MFSCFPTYTIHFYTRTQTHLVLKKYIAHARQLLDIFESTASKWFVYHISYIKLSPCIPLADSSEMVELSIASRSQELINRDWSSERLPCYCRLNEPRNGISRGDAMSTGTKCSRRLQDCRLDVMLFHAFFQLCILKSWPVGSIAHTFRRLRDIYDVDMKFEVERVWEIG